MSETQQIVEQITIADDDDDDVVVATTTARPPAATNDEEDDEDLEDGEIDDDDDEEVAAVSVPAATTNAAVVTAQNVVTVDTPNTSHEEKAIYSPQTHHSQSTPLKDNKIVTIDLVNDGGPTPPPIMKSKKAQPLAEDDHASSIEHAIAKALKKKGIEPLVPKILESRLEHFDAKDLDQGGQGQSRSSRRRKRKKQRDDKEKDKERKEKKKHRYESPEPASGTGAAQGAPPLDDDNDMDDYEMMNVRGGSPPPVSHQPPSSALHAFKDQYDSADDSCSSYDSFDSLGGEAGGAGGGGGGGGGACDNGRRRRRRGKKQSRKRRGEEGRNRDDDRNGKQEKRNRRDSGDEKHRQEPRKLELCKFYLMECCAKRDKCSYMHADFPCKYHYLGMDCVQKDECKFGHGEPLSEQLRNILLKHLETAPKEILGNFKRISRENAIAQVTKRHEELCKQYGVPNTWSAIINLPMSHNRRGGGGGGGGSDPMQQQQHQQQQQQQQMLQQLQQQNILQLQQQQLQQLQQQLNPGGIPSLLDMIINPPITGAGIAATSGAGIVVAPNHSAQAKNDKQQRKSRWADGNRGSSVEPPSNSAPSYLDLKNLTGILSGEHIEKLSQLGIVNLEQVNQLTFGQLNQIGLTISEISEIQLNAINMAKLGVSKPADATKTSADAVPANRDVDMRFLPSTTTATTTATSAAAKNASETLQGTTDKDIGMSSNSNSNSSNGVVTVDYSQYLKDSNLSFDRNDMYDDEKDEEQLVIDDGEENALATVTNVDTRTASEEKKLSSTFASEQLPNRLQLSNISNALKNPFNTYASDAVKKDVRSGDPRDPRAKPTSSATAAANVSVEKAQRNPFKAYQDDEADSDDNEGYYSRRERNTTHATRSRSRTPSQSSTPEASQSPEPQEYTPAHPIYERSTMYDLSSSQAEEDEATKTTKADKDMRFLHGTTGGSSDIDLRLPFQPVTNYTPATEIDGSITSHLPMTYKVYEVVVARSNYVELRQNFKSDQTSDPRLRRILGLPELSKTSAALSRSVRKLSNSIASPTESDGASPKYYTPSAAKHAPPKDERRQSKAPTAKTTGTAQPRIDPRRAAAAAAAAAAQAAATSTTSATPSGAMKQNVEIRNLLQKSEWYKDLNSKFKIMVNQQLALVSTELKKFHQDSSPQKIFDISFITNNSTLQQILTNLGIFIDDNGEVAHVDSDNDELANAGGGIALPNLSQPPPTQQQLDFLRAPPPNMPQQQHLFRAGGMPGAPPPAQMNLPPFGPPPNARPSLLGLPPPGNHFNPFAAGGGGNMSDMGGMNPNFIGGPGIMGGGGPFGFGPNMQQRNFGNGGQQRNHHQQRNQQNRRNNNYGGNSNKI